ncbi:glycosyltransferase family 4 protein [Oleiharenicola lentus]|uniref:glycosyltransferase family 4 protein n=1 Tax=Oleiharenicola lentus TaxID=2508720 RepID=UPI003F67EF0D
MRIAFVSYEYPPETNGGIGAYVRQAAGMLAARGHDIEVFSGGVATESSNREGVFLHRISCPDRKEFSRIVLPSFAQRHAALAFDLVEVPDLYAEGGDIAAAYPDVPMILRAHTPLFLARRIEHTPISARARVLMGLRHFPGRLRLDRNPALTMRWAMQLLTHRDDYDYTSDPERAVAAHARKIVPPSRDLIEILKAEWKLPAKRYARLPYPYEAPATLTQISRAPGDQVISFHGRITTFKGVHTLAAAIPKVLKEFPKVRFVFAGKTGDSPFEDCSLRAFKNGSVVTHRDTEHWLRQKLAPWNHAVDYRGYLSPAEITAHLTRVDICVFPSLWDNFPNACLEAMAAGRAIIGTRTGGMRDMLEGEPAAGLLIPPSDPDALAAAIMRLLRDGELRTRLGKTAREVVLSRYAPSVIGPLQETIYRDAIANSS